MNKLMKKTAAAMLSAAMAVSASAAVGVSASAASSPYVTVGDIMYYETANAAQVMTCSQTATNLTIPESVHGKPVTAIHSGAFAGHRNLVSVTINANIQKLYYGTFMGCTGLQSVRMPNSLREIATSVFSGCTSLKAVDIPYSTQYVNDNAFGDCISLEKLIVHNSYTMLDPRAFRSDATNANTPFRGKVYCYTNSYAAYWATNLNYSKQAFSLGDVNNDNRVDARDASAILGFYASASTGSLSQSQIDAFSVAGDVNRDGRVNAIDASAVLGYYAALSSGTTTSSMEVYMVNEY